LAKHPKARRCFAWSPTRFQTEFANCVQITGHGNSEKDTEERFVAVLEIPPVTSPETAVRSTIVEETKADLKKQMDKANGVIAKRRTTGS